MAEKKTVEELQIEHSRLCALAADNGVTLSDDLTAEFDTALVGQAINASIKKLLLDNGIDARVAVDPEEAQSAPAPKTKRPKKVKATTTQTDAGASQENEPMATKPKKVKKAAPKKGAAKKAKKSVAKKSVAKKAPAKKGTVKKAKSGGVKGAKKKSVGPRGNSLTSKIIARMKNGGITRAETLKITGWKAISMQQIAGNAGLKIMKSAERPYVYTAK